MDAPDITKNEERQETQWNQLWYRAVFSPKVETYETLSSSPLVQKHQTWLWLLICGLVVGLVGVFDSLIFASMNPDRLIQFDVPTDVIGLLLASAFSVSIRFILIPISFLLRVSGSHLLALALGGDGDFGELVFSTACYYVPLTVLNSFWSLIPFRIWMIWLTVMVFLYSMVLHTIVVKTIHRLTWSRSIIAALLLPLAFGVLMACLLTVGAFFALDWLSTMLD